MTEHPTAPERAGPSPRQRPKRVSKRNLRVATALAGAAAFALPWGVLHASPRPVAAASQVVVLPGGQRVVIPQTPAGSAGVRYVYVKGKSAGTAAPAQPATATTRASAPPKP